MNTPLFDRRLQFGDQLVPPVRQTVVLCVVLTMLTVRCLLALLAFAATPWLPAQQQLHPPDVPYQGAPKDVVIAMLKLAHVSSKDVVFDLGCGDGRILIAAAQLYNARGVGIDIDPERVREAVANATR